MAHKKDHTHSTNTRHYGAGARRERPGRTHNAYAEHADNNKDARGGPSNRSRGLAPGAHTRSPTHTVYSAHRGITNQRHTGHYPSTTDTTGPQEGRATGERTKRRQLMDPEPDHTPSPRTVYSASATDQTASTTSRQRTPSLDRTEYSTRNTDYSHIPRRDTNDHDSPTDRSRGHAPDAYIPRPTHTVYSTQPEEPRSTHAVTQ